MIKDVPEGHWMIVRFSDEKVLYESNDFEEVIEKANEYDKKYEVYITQNLGFCAFENGCVVYDNIKRIQELKKKARQ